MADMFEHLYAQGAGAPAAPIAPAAPPPDMFSHLYKRQTVTPPRSAPAGAASSSTEQPIAALHLPPPQRPPRGPGNVELAVGVDGKPKHENVLRTLGEDLSVPVSLAAAAWESVPGRILNAPGHPTGNHFGRAIEIFRQHGARALNEEYDPFSDATLSREGVNPAHVPGWLRAAGELGAQWYNPGNLAAGKTAGILLSGASRATKAARAASPVLDASLGAWEGAIGDATRPLARAVAATKAAAGKAGAKAASAATHLPIVGPTVAASRHFLSRYAALRDRGGTPYVAAGLATQSAPARAEVEVLNDTRNRWAGLTLAQKREVQKLSHAEANPGAPYVRDPRVPEPAHGPNLAERARLVRDDLIRDDAEQEALGIREREQGELFDSARFFPMRVYNGRPVYAQPELNAMAANNPEQALRSAAGRGRGTFSAAVTKPGSKKNATILEPGVEDKLHPDFDPAHQYQQHRLETRRAIENERARLRLETVQGVDAQGRPLTYTRSDGAEQPQFARMPANYVVNRGQGDTLSLGAGEEGRAAAGRYKDATTGLLARAAARLDPDVVAAAGARGVPTSVLGTRNLVARAVGPYTAKVRQAGQALSGIEKATSRAQGAAEKAAGLQQAQVERVAAGLEAGQRSLLLGHDILGTALRENGTVVRALSSDLASHRADASAILDMLRPEPMLSPQQMEGAARTSARSMSAAELDAQRPYWDALAQVGGKITPDFVYDTSRRTWRVAGEFSDIPKHLLAPMRDRTKALGQSSGSSRLPGNIDEIAAMVRKTHPEITDDDVRAFFAEKGRKPRTADFMEDARKRVASEILPKYSALGAGEVKALRQELTAALRKVDRAQGAGEGAGQTAGPLSVAARKAREQSELAANRMAETANELRHGAVNANTGAALAPFRMLKAKQAAEYDRVRQQLEKARSDSDLQTIWRQTFARHAAEVRPSVESAIEARVPEGYVRESDLGLGSPSGRDMALDKSFADFIKAGGGDHATLDNPEAKSFWRTMQVLNRVSRAGIVLFPVVHAIPNLGMAYLAGEAKGSVRGNIPTMARILSGQYKASPGVYERALESGAIAPFSVRAFAGVRDAHALTANAGELASEIGKKAGPFTKAVAPFARAGIEADRRVYEPMNRWLFGTVEQGYAVDMFDRLTHTAMSDGDAAIRVRNMFGKYGDVSAGERAAHLDRLFYFYPWMKTVIAYWIQKGLLDPKWWVAPERAVQVNNEAQGFDDPSRPFTMTTGRNADGTVRRMVLPIPQRVLQYVADAGRIPFDLAHGDFQGAREDASGPMSYLTGHANVFAGAGLDALQAAADGGRAHLPPWNLFATNPDDSPLKQGLGVVGKLAGRFAAPLAAIERAPSGGPLATIPAYLTGAFSYDTKTAQRKKIEHVVRAEFAPLISAARAAHDSGLLQRLTDLRDERLREAVSRPLGADRARAPGRGADMFERLWNTAPATAPAPPTSDDMFSHLYAPR